MVPAPSDPHASPDAADVARRFVQARLAGRALPAYPGAVPERLEDGYAVQEHAIPLWPAPVAGWKLGRIAPPLDGRLGFGRVCGPVFADEVQRRGATADAPAEFAAIPGGFAAVEAEFVLSLAAAPPADPEPAPAERAAEWVADMHIGAEFAGSPLATINVLGPTVVAADFGNNAGLLLGPPVARWRERPLADLRCETWVDGACVGVGGAEEVPGGPLAALADLVALLARRGRRLAPGDLVTTGAATGIHEVRAGQRAAVRFGADGELALRVVEARAR